MPSRGEIWWVELDPARGSEFRKTRPCIVLSSRSFDRLSVRLVVPLTTWQEKFAGQFNKVRVPATRENGLTGDSAVDIAQLRSVDRERFGQLIGRLDEQLLKEVAGGIAVAVGHRGDTRAGT